MARQGENAWGIGEIVRHMAEHACTSRGRTTARAGPGLAAADQHRGPVDVAAGAGGVRGGVPQSPRGHAGRMAVAKGAADRLRGHDKRLAHPDDDRGARRPPPLPDRYVRGARRLGAAAHLRPLGGAGGAGARPPAGAARGGVGYPRSRPSADRLKPVPPNGSPFDRLRASEARAARYRCEAERRSRRAPRQSVRASARRGTENKRSTATANPSQASHRG